MLVRVRSYANIHLSIVRAKSTLQVELIWQERLEVAPSFVTNQLNPMAVTTPFFYHFPEQTNRPKKLLLFINPFGGKKKGLQIYDNTVKPIFALAGVDASVVVSQRSNQIREFIMTQSLDTFDGIVCIGGDGTFSEVFNGLVFRTMKQCDLDATRLSSEHLPSPGMPIGVIPAGSTDTVAYCLNGTTDIRSTVLHIVLGQVNGLDLASVSNGSGLLKFYASVMSYGFLGDVAIDSEKFRWMGPKRYDYSGMSSMPTIDLVSKMQHR